MFVSSAVTLIRLQYSCGKSCFLSKDVRLTMNNGLWIAGIQDKGYNSSKYLMLGRERNMHPGFARLATICHLSFYSSVLALSIITLPENWWDICVEMLLKCKMERVPKVDCCALSKKKWKPWGGDDVWGNGKAAGEGAGKGQSGYELQNPNLERLSHLPIKL